MVATIPTRRPRRFVCAMLLVLAVGPAACGRKGEIRDLRPPPEPAPKTTAAQPGAGG